MYNVYIHKLKSYSLTSNTVKVTHKPLPGVMEEKK